MKTAVSCVSDFEKELVGLAKVKRCDGAVCGHIRHPTDTYCDGVYYLNSGGWVETLSALTEDEEGSQTTHYSDNELLKENNNKKEETTPITKVL